MDPDVFPNSLEYWGPNGMVFFRNVQVRWMPIRGDNEPDVALERPGRQRRRRRLRRPRRAAEHQGPLPAARLHRRTTSRRQDWGYVAGRRRAALDQVGRHRSTTSSICRAAPRGWGSTSARTSRSARTTCCGCSSSYGEGIENYMNDAPVDVGVENNLRNPVTPVVGKPLPIVGHRRCSSTTRGTRSSPARSATRARTSTTATARRPTRSRTASTRSATCSTRR